jgi:hypothetical protein
MATRERATDYSTLQVDAEGYDARILAQLDLPRWSPRAVSIETINLLADELLSVYARLSAHGYSIKSDGRDLLALHIGGG